MSTLFISKPKITLIYAGWWMVWMAEQAFVTSQNGFDWNVSSIDAAITQLIFAIAGYTINTSMRSYQPGPRNSLYVLVWSIALAAICVVAQRFFLLEIFGAIPGYPQFLDSSLMLRGAFGWLMIMLVAVLTWFWVYIADRQESEKRKNDAVRLAREAELTTLRQQLQPHFLFNSLNSISALVSSRPEEARKMIQQLSDFLRGTIKKDDKSTVTLEEELHHLQLYLDIEKVRFGHRLNTVVDRSEDSLTMKIPSLLLQPIVENAIKFGLYDTTGEITILITARKENEMLRIEVKNPFDSKTASPAGTGFGLSSVKRRLYLLFLRHDLIETSGQDSVFTSVLKIPQSV